MADPKLYTIAYDSGDNSMAILESINNGASWTKKAANLGMISSAMTTGGLQAYEDVLYFANYQTIGRILSNGTVQTKQIVTGDWCIGAIHVVDHDNIYVAIWERVKHWMYAYHIDGNWPNPGITGIGGAYLSYVYGIHTIYAVSPSDIYIAGYFSTGVGYDDCLAHYNGAGNLYYDPTLNDPIWTNRTAGGLGYYDGYVYVATYGYTYPPEQKRMAVWRGSAGSWTRLFEYTHTSSYMGDGNSYVCGNTMWIDPATGYIYLAQSRNSRRDILYWDGGSLTNPSDWHWSGPFSVYAMSSVIGALSGQSGSPIRLYSSLTYSTIGQNGRFCEFDGSTIADLGGLSNRDVFGICAMGDATPPVVQNRDPANTETDVLVESNFELEVIDPESGVDADSVIIQVKHGVGGSWIDVWKNDAEQTGYNVTKSVITDGFKYVVNPDSDFPYDTRIFVRVYAENGFEVSVDETKYFNTELPPMVITTVDPQMFDNSGGMQVTATGQFPTDQTIKIYFGISQSENDEPCYCGKGYQYECLSPDGTTLTFVTPPIDGTGDAYYFTFVLEDYSFSLGPYDVVEHNLNFKNLSIKKSLVRWLKA